MPERRTSVRHVLSVASMVVLILAFGAVASLIFVTTSLRHITLDLASSIESVRRVQETEIDLLLHQRAENAIVQRNLVGKMRANLDAVHYYVTDEREAQILRTADEQLEAYFAAVQSPLSTREDIERAEERAFEGLDRLVNVTVAASRDSRNQAIAYNNVADILGVVLGLAILALTAGLVLWLRRRVIQPFFAVADSIRAFGMGQRNLRLPTQGPAELRDMSERFNGMADSIAAQRQAQAAFLGGVAHDLRNPLSALKIAIEMLDTPGPLPAELQLRRTIRVIARQIDLLDRMTSDFLDMSKIEAGELELRLESHDVAAIVRGTAELFDPTSRHRMRLRVPDKPVIATCDALRIEQALSNLVSNAIKYSPAHQPIDIVLEERGDEIVLEVSDRGIGIPREELDRIFQPFQRGANKSAIPGTGLGLANARRIVESHNGRMEVESTPSRGSTFRIYLPREPATSAAKRTGGPDGAEPYRAPAR